ncbi:MAG: hypothetical protein WEB53_06925 [Akkermansiaceae bacterium]
MQTDAIEAALTRLMPPALSQNCQLEIDAMLDDLAGSEIQGIAEIPAPQRNRWVLAAGIAAAVAGLLAVFPSIGGPALAPLVSAPLVEKARGLVLIGESDRIESMTDEGWQEDSYGSAMHAVRLNVVEENSLRDLETGIVMQISEPREELLMMPITAF